MLDSFRDLRLFVAAYEERSFTAAAAREHATQSGVSQHIRKLEERLGVRLFARGVGPVAPTPAGDRLYRDAVALLRDQDAATRAVRAHAGGLEGEVRIGLMPTMTRCALAPALARGMAEQPNVRIRVIEAYSAVLTPMIRAGELDLAVVPAFGDSTGLRVRPFLRTPEVLVSAADAGVPHCAGVRLAALGALRLALPGPGNTRRGTIDTYLAGNGAVVERMIELDAMLGTLDLVATAGWVTILPGIMMAAEARQDRARRLFNVSPLAEPALLLDLVAIEPARRTLSLAAAAFLAVLAAETARLNAVWTGPPA